MRGAKGGKTTTNDQKSRMRDKLKERVMVQLKGKLKTPDANSGKMKKRLLDDSSNPERNEYVPFVVVSLIMNMHHLVTDSKSQTSITTLFQ